MTYVPLWWPPLFLRWVYSTLSFHGGACCLRHSYSFPISFMCTVLRRSVLVANVVSWNIAIFSPWNLHQVLSNMCYRNIIPSCRVLSLNCYVQYTWHSQSHSVHILILNWQKYPRCYFLYYFNLNIYLTNHADTPKGWFMHMLVAQEGWYFLTFNPRIDHCYFPSLRRYKLFSNVK